MSTVYLRRNESTEQLIKRFSRKVKNAGILEEYKKRMYYEKPSVVKRRKAAARKRALEKLKLEPKRSKK
tara:strand:+ start:242 stop:448 length:207 start_codon:yes stop_codon:yes gene_type:complete